MFTRDQRREQVRVPLTRIWPPVAVAAIALVLIALQITASSAGFQGPIHSLISDYVATPKSATVSWVGLGLAMAGLSNRWRIVSFSVALVLDGVFTVERLLRAGVLAFGNGPLIVLTGLALVAVWRWVRAESASEFRGVAFGFLVILATKVGDSWLRVTAMIRPMVLDEYALLADHALAQPSWLFGRLVDAGGPVLSAALHWVYIELPFSAMVVAIYQLRNVRTAGWPRHFLVPTFLVLGLIGPLIYLLFPVVGPEFAFGDAGRGFQVGDFWPHALPRVDMSPRPVVFDENIPRNCMPSMHTAWAMGVFIHSRRGPRWLATGGTFWLVCTVAATLGFGYHYGVDLLAGAVLCLTVEAALREPVPHRRSWRIGLVASGAALLAILLLSCRYLAEDMARHPLYFGPLMIGAATVFGAACYTSFFGWPNPVKQAGTASVRGGFAAAMMVVEPAPRAESEPSRV